MRVALLHLVSKWKQGRFGAWQRVEAAAATAATVGVDPAREGPEDAPAAPAVKDDPVPRAAGPIHVVMANLQVRAVLALVAVMTAVAPTRVATASPQVQAGPAPDAAMIAADRAQNAGNVRTTTVAPPQAPSVATADSGHAMPLSALPNNRSTTARRFPMT